MSQFEHQNQNKEKQKEGSLFSHLRRTAEIESDREALAQLANKRAELKLALDKILELQLNVKNKQSSTSMPVPMSVSGTEYESESISSATSSNRDDNAKNDQENEEEGGGDDDDDDDDDGHLFMATSNSSFFKMCPEDSEKILRVLLEEVEKEIVTICNEAQRKVHIHAHTKSAA